MESRSTRSRAEASEPPSMVYPTGDLAQLQIDTSEEAPIESTSNTIAVSHQVVSSKRRNKDREKEKEKEDKDRKRRKRSPSDKEILDLKEIIHMISQVLTTQKMQQAILTSMGARTQEAGGSRETETREIIQMLTQIQTTLDAHQTILSSQNNHLQAMASKIDTLAASASAKSAQQSLAAPMPPLSSPIMNPATVHVVSSSPTLPSAPSPVLWNGSRKISSS